MSNSSEPTLEKIRERVILAARWHKGISELEQFMACRGDLRPPNHADPRDKAGTHLINWGLDLVNRVSRLEMLHSLIKSDPPLADAMQHPVVPPEPKRLAAEMTRDISNIPFFSSLLQRALAGQAVSFETSDTNPDVAIVTVDLP